MLHNKNPNEAKREAASNNKECCLGAEIFNRTEQMTWILVILGGFVNHRFSKMGGNNKDIANNGVQGRNKRRLCKPLYSEFRSWNNVANITLNAIMLQIVH
jgi:hypothetical protein